MFSIAKTVIWSYLPRKNFLRNEDLSQFHHNQILSLLLKKKKKKAHLKKAYSLVSLEDFQSMLLQKLVYFLVAPSESRVSALQADFQILVEFGSGCWRMESTSPWKELPIVPRDSLESTFFKFVWFYLYNKLFLSSQFSGLQFFPPNTTPIHHFFEFWTLHH